MTRTLRGAVANMQRRPVVTALAIGVIAIALFLVAMVYLAARNIESVTQRWGGGVQMVVYLDQGTSTDRAEGIASVLRGLEAVERVEYVPPTAALDRLRGFLGEHDQLIAGIEPGMLPASLEVTLGEGIKDVAAAHPLIARLESTPGVEEVEFLGEWVEQLTSLTAGLRYAGWFLLGLVALACIYIVATTLGLSLQSRRGEVATLELLGASRPFVRAPLLLEGVMQGALGAGLAVLLLWLLYRGTADALASVLGTAFGAGGPVFLPAGDLVLLIGVGAGLGLVGSWLATGRRALA